ncbi:MAG: sulfite exporter TauE/SafE family protein [Chloroflexi bacterium]|nr:sulfite exporter TauE/SafE family protein [Chloroflexota bacterium]
MIDGALGMAYGVSTTTLLLTLGVSPAAASASVHLAETFTTGLSGISHFSFGNVNWYLVKRLVIPGCLGAIIGAYILSSIEGEIIKPYISAYLLIMGALILFKAIRKIESHYVQTHLIPLGLAGGFLDAIGGGGWGPIVVSTLLARGNDPRFTIGSVNFAEFFVTLAASITFLLTVGLVQWQIILGLAIGGGIAAPLAAYISKHIPTRRLMIIVGLLIILLSVRTLYQTLR